MDGLGPKRIGMITTRVGRAEGDHGGDGLPAGRGVSTSLAVRIYKKYGDKSVDVVRSEPYRLASEVWGHRLQDR